MPRKTITLAPYSAQRFEELAAAVARTYDEECGCPAFLSEAICRVFRNRRLKVSAAERRRYEKALYDHFYNPGWDDPEWRAYNGWE